MRRLLFLLLLMGGCAYQRKQSEVASSLVIIAKDLMQQGQTQAARAVLKNAERLDPDSSEIAALLGHPTENQPLTPLPPAPNQRVTLPYRFTRSGVELKITSIEFAHDPKPMLLVNVSLEEQRGRAVQLELQGLVAAEAGGQALVLQHLVRQGRETTEPQIPVSANQRDSVTLAYATPGNTQAVILRFPTGRWWSSGS